MEKTLTGTLGSYMNLLSVNGLTPEIMDGYYYLIGVLPDRGWVFHISVIQTEAYELLSSIIPILKKAEVSFAIPRSPIELMNISSGRYGNKNIGKIICIYPSSDRQALSLAKELIKVTVSVSGPKVLSDLYLGGAVYVSSEMLYGLEEPSNNSQSSRFFLPENVIWPFYSITQPALEKKPRKLNGKYIAFEVLKSDPKGSVIKAIRRKNFFDFKWVIVKIANQHMCSDSAKQDMRTRLRWQFKVGQEIHSELKVPKVYEYFEMMGDGYLVMEFVKGKSIRDFILDSYKKCVWIDMQFARKKEIIQTLLEMIGVVRRLHEMGYVHRDLTAVNFILHETGLFLLDMELVYSVNESYPSPAFGVGSSGYMSPEQEARAIPTFKEDIYAIGAIMQKAFSGLDPCRLSSISKMHRTEKMFFFLQDWKMAEIVSACLDINPVHRPTLQVINENLLSYYERLTKGNFSHEIQYRFDASMIYNTIQKAIISFSNFLVDNGFWISKDQDQVNLAANEEGNFKIYGGMDHGASGILYMLSRAKQAGFDIKTCQKMIDVSWELIEEHYLRIADQRDPNLNDGMAGIAIGILTAKKGGILPQDWLLNEILPACFEMTTVSLDLFKGLSGQGIGILLSSVEQADLLDLIPEILTPILTKQMKEGDWLMPEASLKNKPKSFPGFMNGTSGIIYFLLLYWQMNHDADVERAIKKALSKLEYDFRMHKHKFADHDDPPLVLFFGLSGVALAFIKAYEIFGDISYKGTAQKLLTYLPDRYLFDNLTTNYGVIGIGEVYLEAYRVFGDKIWLDRTEYIVQAIMHMSLDNKYDGVFWITDGHSIENSSPDLMIGNAGIVHFLIRYLNPNHFGFPMLSV